MKFDVLTLFPEIFAPYLATGVVGNAHKQGLVESHLWNIRDYATDKHKTVDDTPYGGGAGMVLKIEPIAKAIDSINDQNPNSKSQTRRTIVLSARGQQFTQAKAQEYAKLDQLILICGRYEGIDQRVADYLADEEISIGPYVLSGGELPALTVIDTVSRLIPGVLGNPDSLTEESFGNWKLEIGNSVEYPQYTKPETYNGWSVPPVLLSGNHATIKQWRETNSGSQDHS